MRVSYYLFQNVVSHAEVTGWSMLCVPAEQPGAKRPMFLGKDS
jgi:hypothetical protein